MKTYIFGYGSLMNVYSLQKTLPGKVIECCVTLVGYQRKFNVLIDGYLYLNIVQREGYSVQGVLVEITEEDLKSMEYREPGYERVDVTDKIKEVINGRVFAYIAPDKSYPGEKVLQSYIDICISGVEPRDRKRWLAETIIGSEIENDTENPKYEFA